jgi:tRNA-dihydrouridine synthase
MTKAVRIPVTVKMRAGWNDVDRNAPTLARMVEDAGASAVAIHGRTAAQSYSGSADWDLVARVADLLRIPVFGSGDCVEPEQVVARLRSGVDGVLVGRGVLRNPWILAQAESMVSGRDPAAATSEERGRFLLAYVELLQGERVRGDVFGDMTKSRHDRWVVNKIRALSSYYSRGLENGSQFRAAVNRATSIQEIRDTIGGAFFEASQIGRTH